MAWFDDLDLPGSTITGHFGFVREDGPDEDDAPDLQVASGTVTFTPTASAVRAGGGWVGIAPVTATVFDGELVVGEEDPRPLRLLSTDADTGVDGWGWEAKFTIEGARLAPIRFRAPAEGVHLTGDDLIPITGNPIEVITAAGPEGPSAYEVAVAQGFTGTEAEWLASLRGPKGDDSTVPGPANTLSIGTVTTGAAGSNAAASITGAAPNQTLGLTIPQGPQGPQGLQGLRGPTGSVKIEQPAPGVWDFPEQALDVQVADVQGLAARLAALEYDSGLRNITSFVRGDMGWDTERSTLSVTIQRQGPVVEIAISNLARAVSGSGWVTVLEAPPGYRPGANLYSVDFLSQRVRVMSNGTVQVQNPGTPLNYFTFFYLVRSAPPTALPGDPA